MLTLCLWCTFAYAALGLLGSFLPPHRGSADTIAAVLAVSLMCLVLFCLFAR